MRKDAKEYRDADGRPMKKDPRIQKEYRDVDGYWIGLVPGWQNGNDPGCHGIVESTRREAYRTLTRARPCACADCRFEKRRRKQP